MTEKTTDKRASPISYRPPADLTDEFKRRVEQSGLSANAYITRAVFNAPIPRGARTPPAEKQMLAQLLSRAGAIRDALAEAVRATGGDPRTAEAAEAAAKELELIAAGILKMLERGP
jgi:DNA-binding ferritin-like protein